MTDTPDIVERLEDPFLREICAILEEVSDCLDRYSDSDDGDDGQPVANAALRQKCAVDELIGRFPKDRDETFRIGDEGLHGFVLDTCSHGVIEWKPPVGQGYAAWVGESGIQHRHSHPTNPIVALAGAIIKHRDAELLHLRGEVERLRCEREEIVISLGFKASASQSIIVNEARCFRPEMVEARKRAEDASSDALLWQYSCANGDHPTLLVAVWKQRKDANARADALQAQLEKVRGGCASNNRHASHVN